MNIKQFNASYLKPEDRLIFRFNTDEDDEYRFWLTRRVTLFILAATDHLITKGLEKKYSPEASKAIAEFDKELIRVKPSAKGISRELKYQPASKFPIGGEPILVTDVRCTLGKQGAEDVLSVILTAANGVTVNLQMSGSTLLAVCSLFDQLRQDAFWGEACKADSSPGVTLRSAELVEPKKTKSSLH